MTGLRVIPNEDEAEREWSSLLALQANTTPFLEWNFIESLAELYGWKSVTLRFGDTLLAKLVLRQRGIFVDVVVPPFTQYTPILVNPKANSADLSTAIKSLFGKDTTLPFSRSFSFTPQLSLSLGAPRSGWSRLERKTFYLKSSNIEDSISGWSSSTRRNFRKADPDFVYVIDSVDPRDIALMTSKAYSAVGSTFSLPPDVIGSFAQGLIERKAARTVGVLSKDTGELEAGIVLIESSEMAWYWLAGSTKGVAMTVLMAHVQADLDNRGVAQLDLVGANTTSIAEFKRRFGGELVGYQHQVRLGKLLGLAQNLKSLVNVSSQS